MRSGSIHVDADDTITLDDYCVSKVIVSSSPTKHSEGAICHEPESPGSSEPACGFPGKYRRVEPAVYPHRQACEAGGCWENGVPETLQDQLGSDSA